MAYQTFCFRRFCKLLRDSLTAASLDVKPISKYVKHFVLQSFFPYNLNQKKMTAKEQKRREIP